MIRAETGEGTASRTSEKHPAASSARASARSASAFSAVRPCALKPPSIVADCGVSPMWPMTGMPAPTIARTRDSVAPAPSSLTASAPASFTKRIAFLHRLVVGHLERAERHVGDHEWTPCAARDRPREDEHLVHRRGDGRLVAEHRHRRGVADEHEVGAGLVGEPAAGGVVRGDHDDRLPPRLHLDELGQWELSRRGGRRRGLLWADAHPSSPSRTTLSMRRVDPMRTAPARTGGSKSARSM